MKWKPWNEDEDKILKELYVAETPIPNIANILKRSEQAIYMRAQILQVKRAAYKTGGNYPRPHIEDLDWKIYFLRKTTNLSNREIGDELGLTKGQIQRRMYGRRLHLQQPSGEPPEWFKEAMEEV